MDDITLQFEKNLKQAQPMIDNHIIGEMRKFGTEMIDNIIPVKRGFKDLTGNTITSFAYGIYLEGNLVEVELYSGDPPVRRKLSKGEIFDGVDYDGNKRYFIGTVDTNQSFGSETSISFLSKYKTLNRYSIVFTTGTEYSELLESKGLNVLTDGKITAITSFIQSFKPIK